MAAPLGVSGTAPASKPPAPPKGGGLSGLGNALSRVAQAAGRASARASRSPGIQIAAATRGLTPGFAAHPIKSQGPSRSHLAAIAYQHVLGNWGKPAGIAGNLVSQIVHLPQSTLIGLEGLGGSVAKSLETGSFAPLGHEASSIVTSDPFYQAISKGSFTPLEKNPLGTLLDASGVYGLAGRGLGAVARSGAVGEDAARAAALGGRAPREVAPGIAGTAIPRGYSPNVFNKGIQQLLDARSTGLPAAARERTIRQQLALSHAAEIGQRSAEEAHIIKTLKAVVPKGNEERTIAPLVTATGQNRAGLERLLNDMQREPVPKNPDTAATRDAAVKALTNTIAKDNAGKFDWGSTNRVAAAYQPLQALVEAQKHALGIKDAGEMDRALMNRRALLEPDVHHLKTPTTDPRLVQAMRDAKATAKGAQDELTAATRARAAYSGVPGTRGAYRGASAALSDLTRSIPIHPVTDHLMNKALDLRQILDSQHPQIKAFHDARVEYLAKRAADTKSALADARRAVQREKLQGTMIEDSNVPQLRSGPLKGMSVRPLTAADVARITEHDPALHSYVTKTNPEREGAPSIRQALGRKGADQIRPAQAGLGHYTGESLLSGDYRTGWSALAHSLLRDVGNVSATREEQAFLDRFSLPHPDTGIQHFPTLADAKTAERAYEGRTGIHMTTLEDANGAYRVVPKTAVRELNRQRALDRPSALGKLLTTPNAIFRKTVLPYSPKLPVMHQVENVSRVAALEHGNLPRAILDYRRGRNMLDASAPAAGERLRAITTPGSLSRSGAAGEDEMVGRLPVQRGPVRSVVHGAIRGLDATGTQIIRGQRALEKSAQVVALGAHGRQLLQEAGHSWLDANTAVKRYTDELARGLATPQDAERAAAAMHNWLGQYNAFTANSRLALRALPFGSWYLNAARLVFLTLPRDHPLFSALVQDSYHAMQPQWQQQHAGLPGDLQTAVKAGPGAWLDVGKLTPVGLPNENPLALASQLVTPWASSAALALAGKDPFMQDLKAPGGRFGQTAAPAGVQGKGAGTAALSGIEQLVEGLGGPLNDLSRLVYSHGGTFYNTDTPVLHLLSGGHVGHVTLKPGSTAQQKGVLDLPGALDRVLDPFHPTTYRGGARAGALGKTPGVVGGAGGIAGKVPTIFGQP